MLNDSLLFVLLLFFGLAGVFCASVVFDSLAAKKKVPVKVAKVVTKRKTRRTRRK